MFTSAQQQYIDSLLATYAQEGYDYYVIYSHTMVSSGYYNTSEPDLYAVFSKSSISAEDAYTYDVQDDSVLVVIRSGNYSSSSSAVNTDRVSIAAFNSCTLEIEPYEHIYTNAEWTLYPLQPDYSLQGRGESNVQLQAISLTLLVSLIISLLSSIFHRR